VTEYLSLFTVALLSATLLPGGSEVLLSALVLSTEPALSPLLLWAIATTGNTLGAVVNWWLGRYLLHFQQRRWFPFKADTLARSQRWFQRYGVWSLLLAWAPLVGDGLTFVAGVMRVGLLRFVLLVAVGKGARYAVLLWILLEVAGRSPRP
jgi:membrane protein YqaA with SNARE-associated domain